MDSNRQGLAPAQVSRLTGRVDSNAPAPAVGTGVQPGKRGARATRGQAEHAV